jgi:BioD-like phosphotransacetylase family protein
MNTVTPRIFVAATEQNDGKTTTCLGLFAALQKRLGRIGYIKPVGQRFVSIDGLKIDEDSVLIEQTYNVHTPLEAMSPIAIEPDFTRRYIEEANHENLVRRIQNSFDRTAWEKDFVIIEGSGHAGVGSVFDLSNASVAKVLASKAILVTRGGIGRPVDEIALNKALFEKEGVEVVGAIINKVLPSKMDTVREFAGRGLERLGVELLGCMPENPALSKPSLGQICKTVKGSFLNAEHHFRRQVKTVVLGAMSTAKVTDFFTDGTLIISPGDREDILLAALSTSDPKSKVPQRVTGIVLSGDSLPDAALLQVLKTSQLPVIASPLDSYTVASRIHSMTVKTLPGDQPKIDAIQSLIEREININRLLEKIAAPSQPTQVSHPSPAQTPKSA